MYRPIYALSITLVLCLLNGLLTTQQRLPLCETGGYCGQNQCCLRSSDPGAAGFCHHLPKLGEKCQKYEEYFFNGKRMITYDPVKDFCYCHIIHKCAEVNSVFVCTKNENYTLFEEKLPLGNVSLNNYNTTRTNASMTTSDLRNRQRPGPN